VAEPNHYNTLGVKSSASADEIKAAYRAAIKQWHPDRNPDKREEAERRSAAINAAWKVLKDPAAKKRYDESLRIGAPGPSRRSAPVAGGQRKAGPTRPKVTVKPGGIGDMLYGMHQQARANVRAEAAAGVARGSGTSKTGEYELWLTPEEARQGGLKVLEIDGTAVKVAIPPGQSEGKTVPLILRVRIGR